MLLAQPSRSQSLAWLSELKKLEIGDADTKRGSELLLKVNSSQNLRPLDALHAMKGANPIAKNWLIGVANSLHRTAPATEEELIDFLTDERNDSEARYRVFEWITRGDEKRRSEWLSKLQKDASPELRFAAIEEQLTPAKDATALNELLDAARHPSQILAIIAKLKEVQVEVDQAKHFGFVTRWNLIGPFDNVGMKNFDKVFPIESDWLEDKVAGTYPGKHGDVSWQTITTDDREGSVDLAKAFNNEKGCIVYAMSTFHSPIDGPAQLRLGSIVGHKVWLNGKLVMKNEVYHAASTIDQYIDAIDLKKGENRILVKLSQNEQKEDWAQRFQFLIRFTDETGKAIHEATNAD